MNYGMYLAASGMMVNQFRQDVVANNIANLNTPGFKADSVMVQQRLPERVEDGVITATPQQMLEGLGGGVFADRVRTQHTQGQLMDSGGPLDIAIDGPGFLRLSTGRGEDNQRMRFTRDGRLALGSDGTLVHATSGMKVLGVGNRVIRLEHGVPPEIDSAGVVTQNGQRVGQLQLVSSDNLEAFVKAGKNTYQLSGNGQEELASASGTIRQGWYEASGVDPMKALLALKSTSGAVANSARMLQYHDKLMDSAINRLGRVT